MEKPFAKKAVSVKKKKKCLYLKVENIYQFLQYTSISIRLRNNTSTLNFHAKNSSINSNFPTNNWNAFDPPSHHHPTRYNRRRIAIDSKWDLEKSPTSQGIELNPPYFPIRNRMESIPVPPETGSSLRLRTKESISFPRYTIEISPFPPTPYFSH